VNAALGIGRDRGSHNRFTLPGVKGLAQGVRFRKPLIKIKHGSELKSKKVDY
jgi:hypothetical protein